MNHGTADVGDTADDLGQPHDADRALLAGGLGAVRQPTLDEDVDPAGEPAVDYLAGDAAVGLARLPLVGAAVRRRAVFWCLAAVVGLCLGAALYVVRPPAYEASTSVLVTQNPALNPLDAVQTDVALAESRSVAGPVLRKFGLDENVAKFIGSYSVVAVTDRVLVFTVSASSSSDAVSRAAALAAEFLSMRARELLQQQQLVVSSLNAAVTHAKHRVVSLSATIAAVAARPSSATQRAELSGLQTRLHQATTDLAGLQAARSSYQASAQVTTSSMIAGSRVLDSAAALPRSKVRSPVAYAAGGAVGGLLVGIAIVVIGELVSDRLRRRDDIAAALGAPVELSAVQPPRFWPRGLGAARGPGVQRIVEYLGDSLTRARAGGKTPALAVVALDEPRAAALSVAALALALAGDGKRVLVADLADGAPAARLLGVRRGSGIAAVTAPEGKQLIVTVPDRADFARVGPVACAWTGPDGLAVDGQLAAAYAQADLLLTVATLDPAVGAEHLPSWAAGAVVTITAGKSSATRIHTAGEMIRLAGTRLISGIVLDSDDADESLGMRFAPDPEQAAAEAPTAIIPVF